MGGKREDGALSNAQPVRPPGVTSQQTATWTFNAVENFKSLTVKSLGHLIVFSSRKIWSIGNGLSLRLL